MPDPAPLRRSLPYVALFFLIAVVLQWQAGSYRAEFGSYHDEPAHYITGLLLRDFALTLGSEPPMAYAEDYYLHYPKVAFGHWPPVFYLIQTAWTLPFGASRASVMLLMAFLSALLAAGICREAARRHGTMGGLAAGLLMLTVPLAQEFSRVVMADLPQALLSFAAAVCLAAYFERPRWTASAGFGLFAAAAILNKGTGAGLALMPVLMLLFTFRFRLLLRPSLWLSAVIVVALAGPWYLLAPNAMHESAVPMDFVLGHSEWRPRIRTDWLREVGVGLLPLAAVGAVQRVLLPLFRRRAVAPMWAAAAALMISTIGFRAMTPVTVDTRHALPAVPALLLFAVSGGALLLGLLRGGAARLRVPVAAAAVLALLVLNVRALPPKTHYGFSAVAEDLVAEESLGGSVLLVSADALGEGMLIAEVAMREHRPGHIVLRSSKVLSESGWMGEGYRSRFDTVDQLQEYLDGIPVGILILDESQPRPAAHHRLLQEVVVQYADRWERMAVYDAGDAEGEIVLYRLRGHEQRPVGPIDLDFGPPGG